MARAGEEEGEGSLTQSPLGSVYVLCKLQCIFTKITPCAIPRPALPPLVHREHLAASRLDTVL